MTLLSDAFKKIGIGKFKVIAGGIYRLRDSIIKLPDGDAKRNRTEHEFRSVLVLSNQTVCNSLACPVVTVVPLSHRVAPRAETDLLIKMTPENGLNADARLMLGYIQPIQKCDLEKQFGQLSDDEWDLVMGKIVWNFDR